MLMAALYPIMALDFVDEHVANYVMKVEPSQWADWRKQFLECGQVFAQMKDATAPLARSLYSVLFT